MPKVTALSEEVVIKTISFIKNAHGLVVRKSGDPYYTHPMTVTTILLEVTQDSITLLAGLLHDVVEDTPITLNQIALMYGMEVATIVDTVTHYNTSGFKWKLSKNKNIKLLNKCKDSRVIQIKLADRLHNLRTLGVQKSKDQQRIAEETLTFYIPWGKRNKGPLHWLEEMERICEKMLQPRHS
ncbi:Bifunctional (p)ppGpp synthase/hydrolase RelA [Candidatus Cardinium hertigii]|uniref:Bifunctional (P)ppGpp synthase/hydrolase RelA n=1 Tax=Candidatus Cardinium hertigii TaxID=247481 RepID=A0A2Z3LDE4_9BACT|nr:Bifunctional (p)ppGpp synthase/hydrolase RelA [Candidatus Cardinium hertigii]